MKSRIIIYCSVLLMLSGCIYPFAVEYGDTEFSDIVVSGNILIGEPTRITLGYVYPIGTTSGEMRKKYPTGTMTLEHSSGRIWNGSYLSRGMFHFGTEDAPASGSYRLHIKPDNGQEYMSDWAGVCQVPEIKNLRVSPGNGVVQIVMDLDGADSLWNFRWDYSENWEYHADYRPDLMFVPGLPERDREDPSKIYRLPNEDEDYYYCWNSDNSVEPGLASAEGQSVNSVKNVVVLNISRADLKISRLYAIDVTVSGLSSGGRAWQQHLKDISNDTGSLFSPTPSDMPGNIHCISDPTLNAVGYVDAVCRTSQRLFVGPEYYRRPYDPELLLFYPEADEDGLYNFDNYYYTDSPVRLSGEKPSKTNVKWGPKRCVDCRALGGGKNKPEWWPNDDK